MSIDPQDPHAGRVVFSRRFRAYIKLGRTLVPVYPAERGRTFSGKGAAFLALEALSSCEPDAPDLIGVVVAASCLEPAFSSAWWSDAETIAL